VNTAAQTNQGQGWIQLHRGPITNDLLKDVPAFNLLCQIALRARRSNARNIHGLSRGEAMLGDYENQGLTRGQYRAALKRLVKYGFIEITKKSAKGTIVQLINTEIFDINEAFYTSTHDQHETNMQPSNDHQATTNKNANNDKNFKNKRKDMDEDEEFISILNSYGSETRSATSGRRLPRGA
jgi:hypothetical protein